MIMIQHVLAMEHRLSVLFIFGVLVLTFRIYPQNGSTQSTENINLTGTWKGDDGGTYYIRNLGNYAWWLGISGNDDGRTFSSILKGYIHENNKTITADWIDIPRGDNKYYGTLTLSIDSNMLLHKINETSYDNDGNSSCCFGALKWQR